MCMRCWTWGSENAGCVSADHRRAGNCCCTMNGSGWPASIPTLQKIIFIIKHQTVDIIKLNGSVELGPLVGLSEVIVDIVETGSTLKENGLEVLEEICQLSARMIVNPVSMQMERSRIREIVMKLQNER